MRVIWIHRRREPFYLIGQWRQGNTACIKPHFSYMGLAGVGFTRDVNWSELSIFEEFEYADGI